MENSHTFGEGNPVSGAASRWNFSLITELGAQHGINDRRLDIRARAFGFWDRLRARVRRGIDEAV